MKLAVYDEYRIGVIDGNTIRDITGTLPAERGLWPEQRMNWVIRNFDAVEPALREPQGVPIPVGSVTLRAASPAPAQIFALPANYAAHHGEIGARSVTTGGRTAREVGFFLKAAGSVCGAGEAVELPAASTRRFDHECELGVIIGRGGRNISRADAGKHVFGYACLIDVTMRIEPGLFEEDRSLRKSFCSFTPLGPYLVTADEVPDVTALRARLSVNGELRQSAVLGDMIVGIPEAIELISSVVGIRPGDIIASGTPSGVAPLQPGDQVLIEIDSVGSMTLPVVAAGPAPRPF